MGVLNVKLFEKYRPREWSELVGQPKAVAQLRKAGESGFGGQAYLLTGASGTGKTSAAYIVARELADDMCIVEIDAQKCSTEFVDRIENDMLIYGWGKGGRVWIVNEVHQLRAPVITRFLTLLEALPGHVAVIFTTTRVGEAKLFDDQIDAAPLASRCIQVAFTTQGLTQAFAEDMRRKCIEAGTDGEPIEEYVKLFRKVKNNYREAWQAKQGGYVTTL